MKTKHWIFLFTTLILIAILAQVLLIPFFSPGSVATIYHHNTPIESIDLDRVNAPYYFTIRGERGETNVVFVEPGRISIQSATCPDQLCVHQGPITDGSRPIVCLPHRVVIQIGRSPEDAADAVAGG